MQWSLRCRVSYVVSTSFTHEFVIYYELMWYTYTPHDTICTEHGIVTMNIYTSNFNYEDVWLSHFVLDANNDNHWSQSSAESAMR